MLLKLLAIIAVLLANIAFAQPNEQEQKLLAQVKFLQSQGGNESNNANNPTVNKVRNSNPIRKSQSQRPLRPTRGRFGDRDLPPFEAPYAGASIQVPASQQGIDENAFNATVRNLIPMSPEQVHRLRQIYNASQFAAAAPAGIPPKPTATSLYVNLSPGATPPVIRLSEGFVTSLVFLDSTGAPWPIEAYDIGNPQAFNIEWDKKTNVMMVQAKSLYTYGNLAVRLRGLTTPVMLTLIPGQKVVDYRVDITVPGYGPDAKKLPIRTGLPPPASDELLKVLDGIAPTNGRRLKVSDYAGEVWVTKREMYLRTKYTLLSPGWLATMSSADGTHAYELQKTPMLLMSINGDIVHVKVEGF
ncbi:MAG: DotH/IcmK family type IV secretion protein [Pseudomonadota bacterium]